MNADDIKEALRLHALWLAGDESGVKARLGGANLSGAHLREAVLGWADLGWANLRKANLRKANLRKANLRWADLRGADLRGVNLAWATGDSHFVRSLQANIWPVAWTADRLQIDCQNHAIESWWEFDDDQIAAMDTRALDWWRVWKPILQAVIAAAPCEPTGAAGDDLAEGGR